MLPSYLEGQWLFCVYLANKSWNAEDLEKPARCFWKTLRTRFRFQCPHVARKKELNGDVFLTNRSAYWGRSLNRPWHPSEQLEVADCAMLMGNIAFPSRLEHSLAGCITFAYVIQPTFMVPKYFGSFSQRHSFTSYLLW